ncbi:MAG: S9 family peptidase [Phycisphaerae bacterium]|nr:S9 family peptidase [Phycisphaerae bacterium]
MTDADKAIREAELAAAKNLLRGDEPDHIAETKRKAVADGVAARNERVKAAGGTAYGFVELLNDFDASYDFIDNVGTVFYFLNDLKAPRNQVLAIDVAKPERSNWKVVVPESDATLVSASIVGDHIICNYLKDAASQVKVFDLNGKFVRDVQLPGIGTAGGFGGKRKDPETFYSFTSFTTPPTIYRYDVKTGVSTVFKSAKVDFNPADYEVKQVFYASKDGTKVPMFIAHRKGLKLDGTNPTLLYAYGGFNISITPTFSVSNLVWMEMGGVYAVANIRGGGEYGVDWHQAGTKLRKQNVFDDFIAAGEWLIANKYTQPKKLAIRGGSNGGLLVGACMTQRPELFGAALPAVGVMDMLRFHKFTIGHAWRSDYGSSENADEFRALYAYSPYHALLRAKPGTHFPATMVTTADHDDRVVPGHSFKFAAALQAAGAPGGTLNPENPLIIRIETRAGHGAGKPTAKIIEEAADTWAFLVRTLGFSPTLKAAEEPSK